MIKKIYIVHTQFYSGFKASEDKYHEFEHIIDAWNFYKRSLSHDFEYDDAYHTTYKISPKFRFYAEKTNKHYKRPKPEKLSAEEIKYLLTFDDIEEEIII